MRAGARLPLITVSPWVQPNTTDHTQLEQTSITKFIEDNWLSGARIGNQSFDQRANSLSSMFDFNVIATRAPAVYLNPSNGTAIATPPPGLAASPNGPPTTTTTPPSPLTTATPPPPPTPPPPAAASPDGKTSISKVKVSGTHVSLRAVCKGSAGQKCKLSSRLTIKEARRGHKVIAITARKPKKTYRTVGLGQTNLTLLAGKSKAVKVFLNGKGKGLVAKRHKLKVRLKGTQSLANKKNNAVLNRTVTFKAPKKKNKHR
jgi:hypothetical protein